MDKLEGWSTYYKIFYADGKPVDKSGMYFVLKLGDASTTNPDYTKASRAAVLTFADHIQSVSPSLADNIRTLIADLEHKPALN